MRRNEDAIDTHDCIPSSFTSWEEEQIKGIIEEYKEKNENFKHLLVSGSDKKNPRLT